MELRHLRYFTAVAAEGSFNRAAQRLHLTQPALSRQIRDLEDELGVPLFVRGNNAITLTAAGEIFFEEAREILARATRAVERVRGEAGGGTLRVGYAPSLTAGILPAVLEKFCSRTPRVRVELSDLSTMEMLEQAGQGRLDLVLTVRLDRPGARALQWTEVRRLPLVAVMPRTHPLARLQRVPPRRLKDEPFAGYARAEYPEFWVQMRAAFKPFGFVPRAGVMADGISSLLAALQAGQNIAVLPVSVTPLLPPSLVFRPFSPALPPIPVVAGVPSAQPHPYAEKFIALLREEARGAAVQSRESRVERQTAEGQQLLA
jgi:LysR family hca operon transcriptional activator